MMQNITLTIEIGEDEGFFGRVGVACQVRGPSNAGAPLVSESE